MKAQERKSLKDLGGINGDNTETLCLGSFLLDSLLRMLLMNFEKAVSVGF